MATLPTRLVEIEFDAGVWTDVAADTVSISTRRGRNRESGAFEAGTLSVVVRNDGRKYDPDNSAGTYYGKLRPNRRIRLRATYNAVTYPVWQGYIDRITQDYGGPNDATATIDATDIFKLLARTELFPSPYATEVWGDAPVLWWRLDDPAGSTTAVDYTGNGRNGTMIGTGINFGAATLIAQDPGASLQFTTTLFGTTFAIAYGTNPSEVGGLVLDQATPWAIEFWVNPSTAPAGTFYQGGNGIKEAWPATTADAIRIRYTGTALAAEVFNSAGTTYTASSLTTMSSGVTYHVVVTHDSDRFVRVYLDGALLATSASATTGTFTVNTHYLGDPFGAPIVGRTDEFAIYKVAGTTALSSARIGGHNVVGRVAWNGDLPGTRIGKILDTASVPTADRNLDAGTTTLQATTLGGSALGYAQKVEETEYGRLFVAKDGKVRFIGRQSAETGTYLTSQATLVDDDSGAGTPYRWVSADVDESTLVTRATATRTGGPTYVYSDAAALAEFKIIDETHDGLLHDNDIYTLSYAQWIVNTHKTPSSRIGALQLELPKDPVTMYPAILSLEIGDRVTYKRKPQNTGAVTTQTMRVEAISHETGAHYWRTALQLSPFYLTSTGTLWILETVGLSELGTTTILGL